MMRSHAVFLAYDVNDLAVVLRERIAVERAWQGLTLMDYDVRVPFQTEGAAHVQASIAARLGECHGLICCVGMDTWRSPWIEWELEYARVLNMPVVGWRVPGSDGCRPPKGFEGRWSDDVSLQTAIAALLQ